MNQMVVIRAQAQAAVLDSAHIGDIEGALGTIYQHDTRLRPTWRHRWVTLLAILGPGLIVMVGDTDAGAFATYTQAGQNAPRRGACSRCPAGFGAWPPAFC